MRYAAVWLFHALLLIGMLCLWKSHDIAKKGAFRAASVVSAAGLIAVDALSEQTVLTLPEDALGTWTIQSVVLIVSVIVFHMNHQYENEKELAQLKSEQGFRVTPTSGVLIYVPYWEIFWTMRWRWRGR